MHTINGVQYNTYQEATMQLGLFVMEKKAEYALLNGIGIGFIPSQCIQNSLRKAIKMPTFSTTISGCVTPHMAAAPDWQCQNPFSPSILTQLKNPLEDMLVLVVGNHD